MRVQWIEHRGLRILFEDYHDLSGDQMVEVLREAEKEFENATEPFPVLLDYTNSYPNPAYMNLLQKLGKDHEALIQQSASVGVTGLRKVLASGYNHITGQADRHHFFDTIEEARDFLTGR